MWKYILFVIIVLFFLGCDNRTTDPETEVWSWMQVYDNGYVIYDEVLDETDDNTFVSLNLFDGSECTLNKYVNVYYSDESAEDEEEIDRDYIILAEKEDYYTRYYQCSYQDTITIDAENGFSPIPSSVICGMVFTTNHYPVANQAFYILQDSTTIVYNITTNGFGHFSSDSLAFGNYQIIEEEYYQVGEMSEFIVNNFYDDYFISLNPED